MKPYLLNFRLPFRKNASNQLEDLRREDMDFRIPRQGSRPKSLDISSSHLKAHLDSLAMDSRRQLQEAVKYLELLNKTELKPVVRLNLSSTILNKLAPVVSGFYRKYVSKGSGFPEDVDRMSELTAVIALLRQMIMSYKVILAADYSLPIRKFNQQLERVDFCSVRILELTLWLQRYLAIRFQKLPAQEWKDFNSVFFIYAGVLDTSEVRELTRELTLFKASGILSDTNSARSVGSLYVTVQLFGLLDITSWPSKSIQIVEQYLYRHEGLIDMAVGTKQNPFASAVVTYDDADEPPVFTERENGCACYINLSRLKEQIGRELEAIQTKKFIGGEGKKRLQPHGKVEDLAENQGLLNLMEKNFSNTERRDERKTLYGSKTVEVYTGLSECYRLLYEQSHKRRDKGPQSGLFDAAAKRSSLLVDDPAEELESQWHVINESDSGLLMRTVETRYIHAMEVGHVVAFRYSGEDEAGPQLGYITRLDRLEDGHVDVAVVRMSILAEAVTIMEPGQDQSKQDLLPGILIQGLEQVWKLILPRYVSYVKGTPAIIKRQSQDIPVRLGDASEAKNGFIVFEVRSPGLN